MRLLLIVGLILIGFGIVSLGYQGITYVSREKVVDVGPIEVHADRQRTIWFSPLAGGVSLVVGLGLVGAGLLNTRKPAL